MQEPKKIPLDPNTPKTQSVESIPMPSIYMECTHNDTFKKEDLINLISTNNNEDTEESTET